MTVLATNRIEVRALLSRIALCVTVAGGLGFIVAGLTAGGPLSKIAHAAIALVCIAGSFAILWCSADGPERWRPFIVSRQAAERIFGAAASLIVLGGIAAATGLFAAG